MPQKVGYQCVPSVHALVVPGAPFKAQSHRAYGWHRTKPDPVLLGVQ